MDNLELLEKQAIDAAINFDWQKAIQINQDMTKLDKKNPNIYLRLGFAYLQTNKINLSKDNYQKALKLQPGNQIAKQNLERLKVLEKRGRRKTNKKNLNLDPNLFLEIPGKTKSVILVNLGQKDVIAQLSIGQEVLLKQKKRHVEIRTKNREYIGCLPDDLSKRLIFFLQSQSKYIAYIKEPSLNRVTIFIKELKKTKKVLKYISFPLNISSAIGFEDKKQGTDEDVEKTGHEDEPEHELEKLAEDLVEEEKIYLPYDNHQEEEEEE